MKPQFLIEFAYIGTKFSGVQSQAGAALTVAGVLEECLNLLWPQTPIKLNISSRTDSGVHALANTATFKWTCECNPESSVSKINEYLKKRKYEVRKRAPVCYVEGKLWSKCSLANYSAIGSNSNTKAQKIADIDANISNSAPYSCDGSVVKQKAKYIAKSLSTLGRN
ncbi:hypothetical protein ACOME3_000189 [Neoechinorhynchus agilis]